MKAIELRHGGYTLDQLCELATQPHADTEVCAAARAALPSLCGLIATLEVERDEWRELAGEWEHVYDRTARKLNRLTHAIGAFNAALEATDD